MALIQSLLSRLRPAGVERVIYASDVVASVDGKGPDELFAEQPHLQTVIDFIAQNVAQLPLKCYIRRGDSDRERDTDGVLPRLLANPNPDMTAFDLVYSLVAEHSLYGRTIWVVGRDASSDSGWQIRPVPEAWVVGKTGSDGFGFKTLKFRDPDNAGGTVEIPTSQCVIFTRYRPGHPALALSPVESLKQTLTEQVEAQAFRRSVWQNGTLISGYISRPSGVEWGDGAAARFKKDMRANWTKGGAHAGGTPVLEDGMEFKSVDFNPRERDWASGVKLSREDCAAAYHVNPAIIWPGDGQTYASAKDNARALYADTLAPLLIMVQRRINKTLLPMIGAPANEYVEFDINAKLMGSFEEQASAFQSAVGAPWMTRQEARAKLNLPAEPDGEMVTPLNVLVGGLASPNDTAPKARYVMEPDAGPLARSGGCSCKACSSLTESGAVRGLRAKAHPSDEDVESYRSVLERFYEHQRKVVLSAMGAKSGRKADGAPAWWDAERWDRELAEDLHEAFVAGSTAAAKRALEQLGIDPGLYDEPRTRAYLKKLAEARARGINAKTLEQLEAAVSGEIGAGAEGSTPAGVFDPRRPAGPDHRHGGGRVGRPRGCPAAGAGAHAEDMGDEPEQAAQGRSRPHGRGDGRRPREVFERRPVAGRHLSAQRGRGRLLPLRGGAGRAGCRGRGRERAGDYILDRHMGRKELREACQQACCRVRIRCHHGSREGGVSKSCGRNHRLA